MRCDALSHFQGRAGGEYEPCKNEGKYKVIRNSGIVIHLCGTHLKRIVLCQDDIAIDTKTGKHVDRHCLYFNNKIKLVTKEAVMG